MTLDHSAEISRLRATVGDLLALSTIPEVWFGREPSAIVAGLTDVLIESLQLDFAFARLCDPNGLQTVEAMRGDSWKTFPEWLQQRLAVPGGQISRKEIVTKVSGVEGSFHGIVIPIGINGERGVVAAACDRADFPDQIDQQLLSVAANNAATAFQNARLINELRSFQEALRDNELQLRKARDELEIKVVERTAELRKSERELRDVLDSIPAIVWSAAPDGSNSYVNSRFVEYCGMPPEQIAGSGWHAATHPDDLERHNAKWLACVASGKPFEDEVRFRRADGHYRWHLQRGVPLRDEVGNIVKWYGVLTDIEARKQAEDRIREQERELRQVLEFTPQLIAMLGPNRERLYANRGSLDYLGIGLDEWQQQSIAAEVHPDDRERWRAYAERALPSWSAYELELRVRKGDGSYRWFLARYNPVLDDKGQIVRWYVACTDIEDRKRAEERLQQENVALREEIDKASMFEEIVGTSSALKAVLSSVSKVAASDSTVLITGETGTGKELIARAVHKRSNRSENAFVSVNCAALAPSLITSELFGYEKGAFTGATQRRPGRFEVADGGTIFLDEVGELSPDVQVTLLRVLQEHEFERVGGAQRIRVDVRVIAATNRDLGAAVASGTFRRDLFYRLNVFPIEVPPLRDRKPDILMLVEYFVERYGSRAGKNFRSIDKKTLELLQSYDWPGNVRELQNIIERSVILSSSEIFSVDESWLSKETFTPASRVETPAHFNVKVEPRSEQEIIEAALAETRGRVWGPSGAAAKLGTPPSTLDHRIKALKINKKQFKYLLKTDQNHRNH
jgi:formate hydrogenlyase transcriptional activator